MKQQDDSNQIDAIFFDSSLSLGFQKAVLLEHKGNGKQEDNLISFQLTLEIQASSFYFTYSHRPKPNLHR